MSLQDERDDFWDLDKLLPKKKSTASPFVTRPVTVEHSVAGNRDKSSDERKLSFADMNFVKDVSEEISYTLDKGLILSVKIKKYADKYDFYSGFRNAALLYYEHKAEKCDFVSFYSYMPQYSQLTSEQKNYYFYWRDQFRRGKYIKSDYSYLYLFVYEILNLPDKILPSEGINMLCTLWREYRSALPRIDAYFAIWIQDYCFIYGLPCPMEHIREFIFDVIGASDFKEFYLSDIEGATTDGIDALLAYLSDYDWRRGRYAGEDDRERYREYMHGSMRRFIRSILCEYDLGAGMTSAFVRRDAFPHSLCTHAVKSRIEIEYTPISHDGAVRGLVTAGVRYTENKIRALKGIKSRLQIKNFPDDKKRVIDEYFESIMRNERARILRETAPEYERLYDAPSAPLSSVGADEIERVSWTTTLRLVDESEFCEDNFEQNGRVLSASDEVQLQNAFDDYGLSPFDIDELSASIDSGISDIALAERINEAFSDGFGDVILEYDDDRYVLIEDYREEVLEWIRKLRK